MKTKIAIIGTGAVGQAIAFSLINQSVGTDYILVDYNINLATGNAVDMQDGAPGVRKNFSISSGIYEDCYDADIIIITAGTAQKPGQSRLDLVKVNLGIMKSIITEINNTSFSGQILIVSNPVDILTQYAASIAKVGRENIIGSGTFLETMRLKVEISKMLDYATTSIHAFMMGEHGEGCVFPTSCCSISGIPLLNFPRVTEEVINIWINKVRERAADIIDLKNNTSYGIGLGVTSLVKSIIERHNEVIVSSINVKGCYGIKEDVYLGTPTVVLSEGYMPHEIPLNSKEIRKIQNVAKKMKDVSKALF